MLSYQFRFAFIPTVTDRNEPFPTDVLESELSMIYPQRRKLYDSPLDTISTCNICTFAVM